MVAPTVDDNDDVGSDSRHNLCHIHIHLLLWQSNAYRCRHILFGHTNLSYFTIHDYHRQMAAHTIEEAACASHARTRNLGRRRTRLPDTANGDGVRAATRRLLSAGKWLQHVRWPRGYDLPLTTVG